MLQELKDRLYQNGFSEEEISMVIEQSLYSIDNKSITVLEAFIRNYTYDDIEVDDIIEYSHILYKFIEFCFSYLASEH